MLYLHAIYLCRCASKTLLAVTLFSRCARGSCQKMSLLHDCLPVKFKDLKFINFHENRHEAFILFKLFHNLFATIFCLLFNIIHVYA